MAKTNQNIAAVIHIGGNAVRLRIAQTKKGRIEDLERADKPLMLGHEVFRTHKISFRSINELTKILTNFHERIVKEYGIEEFRVVAASALRDADNRTLVTDQLKIQSGLDVEVLENSVEKAIIYHRINRSLKDAGITFSGRTLYSFVGSGTTGFAVAQGDLIIHSQNLPIGALKLNDIVAEIREHTEDFAAVTEEFLRVQLSHALPGEQNVQNLVLSGSSLELIAKLTEAEKEKGIYRITGSQIIELYDEIKKARTFAVASKLNISENSAGLLYAVLAIYSELIRQTAVTEIILPCDTLIDGIMEQMLLGLKKDHREYIAVNAKACALSMARSYGCDEVHGEYIRANGTLIFDKLKKIHGLGATERLVLELASLLADCGRSVSQRNRLAIGFDMIRQSEIYGVTFRQRLLTAHVIKYDEFTAPALTDSDFAALTNKEKTVIAKLVAMFRLAKALDASGRQKLYNLRVKIEGDSVVINADAALGNVFLEEWTFKNCAVFFKMVFGLDVILRIRRNMPGVGK